MVDLAGADCSVGESDEDEDLEEVGNSKAKELARQESIKSHTSKTYKFEQLAELIADKGEDLAFSDLDSEDSTE